MNDPTALFIATLRGLMAGVAGGDVKIESFEFDLDHALGPLRFGGVLIPPATRTTWSLTATGEGWTESVPMRMDKVERELSASFLRRRTGEIVHDCRRDVEAAGYVIRWVDSNDWFLEDGPAYEGCLLGIRYCPFCGIELEPAYQQWAERKDGG